MSLFNPWVIFGIVMAVLSSFGAGYFTGELNEYERQQLEIAALNAKARETEQTMAKVAQTYAETLRKANNVAKIKETRLRDDIATGALSLRVAVKAPQCALQAATDAAVASGNTETTAELDGRVAQALVDITSRGDQAIRSLNTCIDQYDQMRNMK
jgi:ferritin-like protein